MLDDEIKAFQAVIKYGNISKTAERLHISQPTLSLRIRNLENRLGCKLFLRSKGVRSVELTTEGKHFVLLSEKWDGLMRSMQDLKVKPLSVPFRVSSLNSVSTAILTEVYTSYLQLRQDTALEIEDISSYASYDAIESRISDFAIVVDRRYSLKATCRPLFTEQMELVCNVNSCLPEIVEITDLNPNYDVYSPWFLEFEQWRMSLFGKDVRPRMQIQIMQHLEYFLEQPDNWSIVPATISQRLLKNPKIASRILNADVPKRNISSLTPSENGHPHYDFFLECLHQRLRQAEKDGLLQCLF